MRDPELVQRAERAATALEQALIHWRQRHGLDSEPLQPVTSYVGYSATEPWGQPRVVLGVHAEEAERLAAILEGHDCIGPIHAGISGWPTQRQADGTWISATGLPPSHSALPVGNHSAVMAATIPAVPFIAPGHGTAVDELEPLPPEETDDAEPVGATAEQFAGPAATWSELTDHGPAADHGAAIIYEAGDDEADDEQAVGRPEAAAPASELPADEATDGAAAAKSKQGASSPAAASRRRVVAPRPRVSPDDSATSAELPDRASAPKWQAPPAPPKRTKSTEPGKDRPARTRLQPASKTTKTRRPAGQRPAAGTWRAVDGQPSATDKSG
jgi:hypothetical protein